MSNNNMVHPIGIAQQHAAALQQVMRQQQAIMANPTAMFTGSGAAHANLSYWEFKCDRDPSQLCFAWKRCSEICQGGISKIVQQFQKICGKSDFAAYCEQKGVQDVTFLQSDELKVGNPSYDKFVRALESGAIPLDSSLGVVFHGTAKNNVELILRHGLDPTKRYGQAFGPGECFASNPAMLLSCCNGGDEMLVFVAVPSETMHKPWNRVPFLWIRLLA